MRRHLSRWGLSLLVLTIPLAAAKADPPDKDFVGAIVYRNGFEPDRIACDTLELVKTIYAAGTKSIFAIHPKYRELAASNGVNGDAQCTVGAYHEVRVLDEPVLLGPIENPAGDAELFFWALHVDNSPKGGSSDYWILYLDTRTDSPWLQVGVQI